MKHMISFIFAIFVLSSHVCAVDPAGCDDEIHSGKLYQRPIADGLYLTMAFSNNPKETAGTDLMFNRRRFREEYAYKLPWHQYCEEVSGPIHKKYGSLEGAVAEYNRGLGEATARFSDIFTHYYPPYRNIWVCFLTSQKFDNLDTYMDWLKKPSVMAKTVQMAFAVYWLDEDFLLSERGDSSIKRRLEEMNVKPEEYLSGCPFSHHISIHRSPLYEGPKVGKISLALHSYAAHITQEVQPSKKMLSFLPTEKMRSICEKALNPDYVGKWNEFAQKVPDLKVDAYQYYERKSDKAKGESPINEGKPALKPGISLDNYPNSCGILISLPALSGKLESFLQVVEG